jgi:tetratricopeptide (TPR) repeat protein
VVNRKFRLLLIAGVCGAAIAPLIPQSAPAAAAPPVSDEAARLYNQGLALWRGGQPDGATAALRRSRAALPYESAFALGVIAARQGDLEGAAQEFARALRAREGDDRALANLQWVLRQLERQPAPAGGRPGLRHTVAMTPEEARRLIDAIGQPRRRLAARADAGRW